jgi:hypothetical protein
MNQAQLDILNEIRVKMFYDPRKTLSEQSVIGAPDGGVIGTREPSKKTQTADDYEKWFAQELKDVDFEAYPIPGYKPYLVPKINNPNGGFGYMYFPEKGFENVEKNLNTSYSQFGLEEWADYFKLSEDLLKKILPNGTIKSFTIKDEKGKTDYFTRLQLHTKNIENNQKEFVKLIFAGYISADNVQYKGENPDDYKNVWEKFLDEWETSFQIMASIIIGAVVTYFTGGMALPFAARFGLILLSELAVNVPVALYDWKKGDNASAWINILFSLLPFIKVGGTVSKEIAESIAKQASTKTIENAAQLKEFFEGLTKDEQYYLSRILKQNPEDIKSQLSPVIQNLFENASKDKNFLKKILLKDQTWWKDMGAQGLSAFALVWIKGVFGREATEEEMKRMIDFLTIVPKEEYEEIVNSTLENDTTAKKVGEMIFDEKYDEVSSQMIDSITNYVSNKDYDANKDGRK